MFMGLGKMLSPPPTYKLLWRRIRGMYHSRWNHKFGTLPLYIGSDDVTFVEIAVRLSISSFLSLSFIPNSVFVSSRLNPHFYSTISSLTFLTLSHYRSTFSLCFSLFLAFSSISLSVCSSFHLRLHLIYHNNFVSILSFLSPPDLNVFGHFSES